MNYEQALSFVRKNKGILKLHVLANKAGIAPTTFTRVVNGVNNQYGNPYNIPEKYHDRLIKAVEAILHPND